MTGARLQISCAGDLWTPWGPEDRGLYERAFAVGDHPASYETNFAYVQQECREQAWKWRSGDLLVTACVRGPVSEFVFVLPPIGPIHQTAAVLPRLCAQLAARTGRRVILRKLPADLHAALAATGSFIPVPLEAYRNPRELPEDIHPQVVAPTRLQDDFGGSDFVKTRNHVKTARRLHHIEFRNLDPDNRGEAVAMIEAWAREHNERLRQSDSAGKTPVGDHGIDPAAFTIFCDRFAPLVDDRLYFGRLMIVDGRVGAFAFAGRTSATSAALYASVCRVRARGTSDCMIVDMLDRLAGRGVASLNLGGSEGLDLFRYKDKWRTSALITTQELEFVQQPDLNLKARGTPCR